MDKKIYLSSSSINIFLNCKRRYKFKYIDKVQTNVKINNKYLSFGESIHSTLAQFNLITERNESYRNIGILYKVLRRNWRSTGYISLEEERQYASKALKILRNYFDNSLDAGKKSIIIEEMVKRNCRDFILCGKIDKMFVRNDDEVEVLDYKTSDRIDNVEAPENNVQLAIYTLLSQSHIRNYPRWVSYYYLCHNKKCINEITDNKVKEMNEFIYGIYNNIAEEKCFPCNPNIYCRYNCEYYIMCDEAKDIGMVLISSLNHETKEDISPVFNR